MLRRCVVAALAGLLLSVAFEPVALPYVMPFSLAAFALTTRGLRVRSGWLPGLAFGVAFYFVHISWMGASLGVGPWVALAGVESVFYGVLGSVATLLHRLRAWPAWLALAWVAMEVVRSTWPFSGMPWGRLGFAVMDSPLSPLLAYVGVDGVSLGVAFLGFLLARLAVGESTRERLLVAAGGAVTLAAMLVPALAPYQLSTTGSVQVAAVQGDVPGDGTDVAAVFRQVTDGQVDATVQLAADVRAGTRPAPDFVVWPENSTAVDPFTDLLTHQAITRATSAIGVPVLVGALVDAGPGHVLNQGIVWDPETGAGDRYTKWHPVPYGEYIPYRSLLSRFSLRVDQVPKDMDSGDRQTPLRIAGVDLGDAICFDIAYDDGLTAQVEHGASMLAVQTSNASFIDTHQIEQQFAMTRARAVETGRWVVVASINGVSGVISPDGTVVERTDRRTRAVLDDRVGLVTGVTPGLRVGDLLGDTAPWSVVVGVLLALRAYDRRRSAGRRGPVRERTGG